jgi:bifunctional non-homologous end joining protein LigD
VYSVHDFSAWRSKLRSDPWKAMLSTRQRLLPDKFDRL